MANKTKIALSGEELKVVTDTHWILTKQAITSKVYEIFNEQVPVIRKIFSEINAAEVIKTLSSIPKISKGENYNGFPYVMLDYPSSFAKDEIFAVRTMMWWGNFVSVTLLLSGALKQQYASAVQQHCINAPGEMFICIQDGPWEHHFEESNYRRVDALSAGALAAIIEEKPFLKIALKLDIGALNDPAALEAAYNKIKGMLG